MKARKHCYSTGTVSQESLLSVFLSTPHYNQTMNSFIPTMGRVSSSYVCVREIISRRKWHQRTLCCKLTILHLAASVCSYFIIWSPFNVIVERHVFYKICYAVILLLCLDQKTLYCWKIYAVGWVGAFFPCVHLCGSHTALVAIHLQKKTRLGQAWVPISLRPHLQLIW